MRDEDALLGFGMFLIGLALLIFVGILAAIVWYSMAAVIAHAQYQKYLKESEEIFDEVVQDTQVGLSIDDILNSIGVELPQEGGFDTVADWMVGTPLGVSEEWPS